MMAKELWGVLGKQNTYPHETAQYALIPCVCVLYTVSDVYSIKEYCNNLQLHNLYVPFMKGMHMEKVLYVHEAHLKLVFSKMTNADNWRVPWIFPFISLKMLQHFLCNTEERCSIYIYAHWYRCFIINVLAWSHVFKPNWITNKFNYITLHHIALLSF